MKKNKSIKREAFFFCINKKIKNTERLQNIINILYSTYNGKLCE